MSQSIYCPTNRYVLLPCVRRVESNAPLAWLKAGWSDFKRGWTYSLSYGVVLGALLLALIYKLSDTPYLDIGLIGGFLLIAPALAAGLYRRSLQLENEAAGMSARTPSIGELWDTHAALFGLMLAVVFAIWIDLSAILTAMIMPRDLAVEQPISLSAWFTLENLPFVVAYFGIGALLALGVFTLGVVTLPMLMDRHTDPVTAAVTSFEAVKANPVVMAWWAAIIVLLTIACMATLFIGFVVAFPVLGHASWHAYRELVEQEKR